MQVLPSLPRIASHGPVSSDLGSYKLFKCSGTGESRSCVLNFDFAEGDPLQAKPGTLRDYLEVRFFNGVILLYPPTILQCR